MPRLRGLGRGEPDGCTRKENEEDADLGPGVQHTRVHLVRRTPSKRRRKESQRWMDTRSVVWPARRSPHVLGMCG